MILKIDTPCIGICSTVYGDKICRGCKRQYEEVIQWNGLTTEQKFSVYQRLDQDMQTIVGRYLTVVNPELLKQTLVAWSVRHRDDQHPLSWAFFALRNASKKIKNLAEIGVDLSPAYQVHTLDDLFNIIDRDLYLHCTSQ